MIRAIIFDCFGVLATDGWLPYRDQHFGHDTNLVQQATDLNKAVDAGILDYISFISQVAELAGLSPEAARREIESNVPNPQLFDYISELKQDYKIGVLSNAGANWLPTIFTSEQVELFDAVALSYEMGIIKPDKRVYEIIAERLGAEPEECIFIDDQQKYAEGGKEAGMQAILYQNFAQFKTDLETLLANAK